MNLIDGTVLNVALPAIAKDLEASSSQMEWISVIYLLAFAVGLLPFGRFGDIFGRRRIFAWGVAGFTVASAICGMAPNIETLLIARLAQGISGAAMIPQILALIRVIFPPEEQGRAFSKFTLVSSLSAVSGPLLGGMLMQLDVLGIGWRAIFLVNLPVGVAILSTLSLIPKAMSPERRLRSDNPGTILFGLAVAAVVVPIIEGRSLGWPWWAFALPVVGVLLGIAFIALELARDRKGLSQLLPATLIRHRQFMSGLFHATLLFSVPPGLILVLGIYLQSGLQLSPLEAGLLISPFPAGVMAASIVTARLTASTQSLRIVVGAGIILFGLALLNMAVRFAGASSNTWQIGPAVLVCGFGMGVAVVALYPKILAIASNTDAGASSGALQALQHVGVVLGIAGMGEVFFSNLQASGATADRTSWSNAAANTTILGMLILGVLLMALWWQSRPGATRKTTAPSTNAPAGRA
jgi:MFS family permease